MLITEYYPQFFTATILEWKHLLIEDKYKDINFFAIDTDHFRGLCKRFNIESIPTVIILEDGYEVKRINGIVLTSAFRSAFADICRTES